MNLPVNYSAFNLARTLRLRNILTSCLVFAVSYVLLAYQNLSIVSLLLGVTLLVCAQGIVTIHNDLVDIDIDKANSRNDIPFAASHVTKRQLLYFALLLNSLGMFIALLYGETALLWYGAYLLLGWFYSGPLQLKNHPILSLVILSICYGCLPWTLSFILSHNTPAVAWSILAASSIFSYGITSLKDFKDVKGDTLYHKRTFLIVFGETGVRWLIVSCTIVASYIVWQTLSVESYLLIALCIVTLLICSGTFHTDLTKAVVRKRLGALSRVGFFIILLTVLATTLKYIP